jgi:hypothetical protein
MKEEVQRLIMLAIQELHGLPTQSIHSIPVIEDDAQVGDNFIINFKAEKIDELVTVCGKSPKLCGRNPRVLL